MSCYRKTGLKRDLSPGWRKRSRWRLIFSYRLVMLCLFEFELQLYEPPNNTNTHPHK